MTSIDLGKSFEKFKLSNYDEFQLNRYGDILPEPIVYPCGSVKGEVERSSEWVELQAELQRQSDEF